MPHLGVSLAGVQFGGQAMALLMPQPGNQHSTECMIFLLLEFVFRRDKEVDQVFSGDSFKHICAEVARVAQRITPLLD